MIPPCRGGEADDSPAPQVRRGSDVSVVKVPRFNGHVINTSTHIFTDVFDTNDLVHVWCVGGQGSTKTPDEGPNVLAQTCSGRQTDNGLGCGCSTVPPLIDALGYYGVAVPGFCATACSWSWSPLSRLGGKTESETTSVDHSLLFSQIALV